MKNLTTLIFLVFSTLAWSVDQEALNSALSISDQRERRIALNELIDQRSTILTSENIDTLITHIPQERESIIIGNIIEAFADTNHPQAIRRSFNLVNMSNPGRTGDAIIRGISYGAKNPESRNIMTEIVNYSVQNNFPRSHRDTNWRALDYLVDDMDSSTSVEFENILIENFSNPRSYTLSRRDALQGIIKLDQPRHLDLLVGALNDSDFMSSTDDIITQIGKYGDKSHLSLLADFLGSDRDYDRLEALKSMQLIMNRELTEEQRTLVASCLPNIDIVPYSDNARAIGMLFDMVLTMGLTTAAMWDGREVAEPLDQETINAMKSFFETLLD